MRVVNETYSTEYNVSKDVDLQDRELLLPSNTLSSGLYKISLTVTSIKHNVSNNGYGFVRVRVPSLVAVIECGSSQTISRDSDVIINASLSYDPANPKSRSELLVFKWFCQGKDDAWFGGVLRNSSVLRLPRRRLEEGKYVFLVKVTTREGERKATASQTIKVVSFDVPKLCIR